MCFSPAVSLTVAAFEFIVATMLMRRSKLFAFLIYLLGFYQFTEYMLCTAQHDYFWATTGFITYSLLPAVGLHLASNFANKKMNLLALYLPAMMAVFVAVSKKDFVVFTECSNCFVIALNYFSNPATKLTLSKVLYVAYYFGYIALSVYFLSKHYKTEKDNLKKVADLILVVAIILSLFPAVILLLILPSLRIMFPSVYCEFALLFALLALVMLCLEGKNRYR
ncbi:hypothetical protein JXA85_04260 [Candidatus Woesearchaeota archaeon]|nr:hypothetical protein [Candidatus Woesearchaeota archaeon]